jgi:NAD(P)-dependent dehydrogenase (short-subunit alcohol dehydrogenase family)
MANIIITGTSTGIGFATAVLLAKNKHTVFATMRNPKQNTELQDLSDKKGLPIIILPLDVTKDSSVKNAIDQVLEYTGKIDVLINNAGTGTLGPAEELPVESFIKEMDVNFFGAVRCTQAVLPGMRKNKSGSIINISSVAGRLYDNFSAPYSSSKAALEAFSECIAKELVPFHIRVAVVEPGVTDTPIQRKGKLQLATTHYPNLKRVPAFFAAGVEHHVQPEVVAEVINNIVNGSSTKFRNPSGPDSVPALGMRASISDEDWIASGGMDEESWIKAMEGMHLDVRKFMFNS